MGSRNGDDGNCDGNGRDSSIPDGCGGYGISGRDLIDRMEMVGAVVEAVGHVVVSFIMDFFAWQQHEQCVVGVQSFVGVT